MDQTPNIEVHAWSGNARPWRARVTLPGIGMRKTGFYATAEGAEKAGERLAAQMTNERNSK